MPLSSGWLFITGSLLQKYTMLLGRRVPICAPR